LKSIKIYGICLWINRNLLYHFSFYLYSAQTSNVATWSGLNFKTNVEVVDVKKHHRCVPKDNEFRCLANGRSIKVGVELSDTIASHKTLTLVVGSFYLYSVQTSNVATWSGLNFKTNVEVVLFKSENLIKINGKIQEN
jgi:hypothetical protein